MDLRLLVRIYIRNRGIPSAGLCEPFCHESLYRKVPYYDLRYSMYIDYGTTFTTNYTTSPNVAASLGVGTQAIVEDMFTEALVRQGIGHFYTPAGTTASEFGVPGSLQTIMGASATYHIYKISGFKTETSKTPMGVLSNKFYIFIAVKVAADTNFLYAFGGSADAFV